MGVVVSHTILLEILFHGILWVSCTVRGIGKDGIMEVSCTLGWLGRIILSGGF